MAVETFDLRTVWLVMGKELREAKRTRWFLVMAGTFAVMSVSLSVLGFAGLGTVGVAGFSRTAAGFVNLALLIVPLMGLLLGALSIAGERERGTLRALLAHPVTTSEIVIGTFAGLAVALSAAILGGFGLSAAVIAWYGGVAHISGYGWLVGSTVLLGLMHVAIGCCISVRAPRSATALGAALVVWLVVVLLGDLGMMGSVLVLQLTPEQLLWLSLANPNQLFKVAAVNLVEGHVEALGPSALYAVRVLGGWLAPVLGVCVLGWIVVPLGSAMRALARRGAA